MVREGHMGQTKPQLQEYTAATKTLLKGQIYDEIKMKKIAIENGIWLFKYYLGK